MKLKIQVTLAAVLVLIAITGAVPASQAQTPNASQDTAVEVEIPRSGARIVPLARRGIAEPNYSEPSDVSATASFGASGLVTYHGGSNNSNAVQHTQKIYTIFWNPTATPFPAGYQTTINQFIQDLSGSSYYGIASQYGDSAGLINTTVLLGGTWLDTTNAIPSSMTTTQVFNEVIRAKSANGWPNNSNSFFLVFTPVSVTSSAFCGYHIYQNFPNVAFGLILLQNPGCSVPAPSPNGTAIDTAISVSAHELMEALTDPYNSGWFHDQVGGEGEISDLCNFNFGARDANLGSNVVLNGHPYLIQKIWSNTDNGCVLSFGSTPPTITGISPSPVSGSASSQTITINGTGFVNKPWVTVTSSSVGRVLSSAEVTFVSSTQLQINIATTTAPDNWTVKVSNPDSTGSNTLSFSVVPPSSVPGGFSKNSPGNSATGQSSNPTISWGSSSGATSYEYCIDTSNNNNCDTSWTSAAGTGVVLGGLSAGVTYWWEVRAVNGGGVTEANSGAWWSFQVAANLGVNVSDSFESGAISPWASFGSVVASVSNSIARTGISSLAETGGSGGVFQDLTGLTPGALYQVTAYAHSDPGATTQSLLFVHDTSGPGNVFDGWRTPTGNGWEAFTVTFIATANGRMRIHLMTNGASGAIYWDDVRVLDASGFEYGATSPWAAFGSTTAAISGSAARTGTSSLAETGGSGGVFQDLGGLTPGTLYQVTAYAHSDPGATSQALLFVHDTSGTGSVFDGWRTPTSNGWEAFTVTFLATANGRMRIHLMTSGTSGAIYWDDVRILDASGFENGATSSWAAFGGTTAAVSSSMARTGTSSLTETGGLGGVYQDLAGLTPGTLYQVTVYAHSDPGATSQALLFVHDISGSASGFDGWRTPTSNGWEAFTVTFLATANGRMRIHLMTSGTSGAIYWDDVRVLDASGFENGAISPWAAFGGTTAAVSSSVARTGTSSLTETGGLGGVYQDLAGLTPGANYQITVYAHSAPGTTAQALLFVHDILGSASGFDGWRTPASNGWDAFTVSFTATANGWMRIHLMTSGGSGAIYWDDVKVN